MKTLLTPRDVDRLFRYPTGRSKRLALAKKIPSITLPDGEIRFDEAEIESLLNLARTAEKAVEVSHA